MQSELEEVLSITFNANNCDVLGEIRLVDLCFVQICSAGVNLIRGLQMRLIKINLGNSQVINRFRSNSLNVVL